MKCLVLLTILLSIAWSRIHQLERPEVGPAPSRSWVGGEFGSLFLDKGPGFTLGFQFGVVKNESFAFGVALLSVFSEAEVDSLKANELSQFGVFSEWIFWSNKRFSFYVPAQLNFASMRFVSQIDSDERQYRPSLMLGLGAEMRFKNISFVLKPYFQYIVGVDHEFVGEQFWNKPGFSSVIRWWI
jgi:hypothetical protein